MYQSPLYKAWVQMKTRCNNPHYREYDYYGGRGIRICERWASFANFLEDMGPAFVEGLTLDRIDNDGDYAPGNCRWATSLEQNNNRRNNRRHEYQGESHTLPEWARIVGLNVGTVRARYYKHGWPIERCLTEGVRR